MHRRTGRVRPISGADAAIYIDRRYHRRGAGRQLYAALFDTLRRQRIVNVYAGITLPNAGSVGLHESMGFLPIGVYRNVGFKLGAWHDVGWWHLQLQPLPESPLPPVPFPDLA
jgi:phosphinothricin acetyltransferase